MGDRIVEESNACSTDKFLSKPFRGRDKEVLRLINSVQARSSHLN